MKRPLTRRRVLQVVAATSGLGIAGALGAFLGRDRADGSTLYRWDGIALGAEARLLVHAPEPGRAERLVERARAEIARLDAVYSLYRPESALARLNAQGYLDDPPPELVQLLARARAWSEASDGAFDVTVQPLWSLYRDHFAKPGADPAGPDKAAVAAARVLVDYRAVAISPARIHLAHPGMAVTLNGIAQGDITDRVADLLRAEGVEHTLVNLGEYRALGAHPAGRAWKVGIEDPHDVAALAGKVDLTDRAIATSAVTGTAFDPHGRHHHLFDPAVGRPARGLTSASVIARNARDADACSTAMLASSEPLKLDQVVSFGVEWAFAIDAAGTNRTWMARG